MHVIKSHVVKDDIYGRSEKPGIKHIFMHAHEHVAVGTQL